MGKRRDLAAPPPAATGLPPQWRPYARRRGDDVPLAGTIRSRVNRLPPATRELNWEDEDDSRLHAPARTNEERLCRQVIRWVRRLLHDTPEQAQQTVARLEAEFVEAQARPGGLRLPDPARVEPIEELGRVRSAAAQPPYRDPLRPPHQVEDTSGAKD